MNEFLEKAQKKQEELKDQILSSEEIRNQRPLFHFATPGGWCNDPNGFSGTVMEHDGKHILAYTGVFWLEFYDFISTVM